MFACQESLDDDVPTPLEFAFELLGVNHRDTQEQLVSMTNDSDTNPRCYFSEGWDAGVDCSLEEGGMPVKTSMTKESRAWLVGFVAGQYAAGNNYPAPFCIFTEHDEH